MPLACAEPRHVLPEARPDRLEQRRGHDRLAPVIVEEIDHPAGSLQLGDVPVEVEAVQALNVQHGMTIEQLRDRDHTRHDNRPAQPALRSQPEPSSTAEQAEPSTSAVRGGASLVRRADLNGSPGWASQGRRFLLASCAFGKLDRLPWPQKSPTKQRVARQPDPAPSQGTLFDGLADDEFAGLIALATATYQLDMETFVVAHTLDPFSQSMELVFGRPCLNSGGGEAWHWYQDLLVVPPSDGGRRVDDSPSPQSPDAAPDAPVPPAPSPE